MIDCKKYADEILDSVKGYGHLAVVSIGDDPASSSFWAVWTVQNDLDNS